MEERWTEEAFYQTTGVRCGQKVREALALYVEKNGGDEILPLARRASRFLLSVDGKSLTVREPSRGEWSLYWTMWMARLVVGLAGTVWFLIAAFAWVDFLPECPWEVFLASGLTVVLALFLDRLIIEPYRSQKKVKALVQANSQ